MCAQAVVVNDWFASHRTGCESRGDSCQQAKTCSQKGRPHQKRNSKSRVCLLMSTTLAGRTAAVCAVTHAGKNRRHPVARACNDGKSFATRSLIPGRTDSARAAQPFPAPTPEPESPASRLPDTRRREYSIGASHHPCPAERPRSPVRWNRRSGSEAATGYVGRIEVAPFRPGSGAHCRRRTK